MSTDLRERQESMLEPVGRNPFISALAERVPKGAWALCQLNFLGAG
jgi:hypothetical protein